MHLATKNDLPFINSVLNHPFVRPHIWDEPGPIDARDALEAMWTLVVPSSGVMMAEALGGGNYLALVAFLPCAWGASAVVSMRQGIRRILTETDCCRLYGSVHPTNRRAARNLIAMGLKEVGLHGNRVTGHVDYTDILDEQAFIDTVNGGWPGKALYWWGVKAKLENLPMIHPIHPTLPIFDYDGVRIDLSQTV